MSQLELIADQIPLPPGFLYQSDFISDDEERRLVNLIAGLRFSAVVMRGVAAKRRTAHFGRSYEFSQTLERRSVYLIDGKARSDWQHHIPPAEALRYSITFRTLRGGKGR